MDSSAFFASWREAILLSTPTNSAARIGLGQGTEPVGGLGINSKVQPIKLEVAKSLNSDWKHPAPATIDAPGARAIGVLGGWKQSVSEYVGSGVLLPQPGVIILAGWPEFGSVLPPGGDDLLGGFNECRVVPAYCAESLTGLHSDLCGTFQAPFDGSCDADETMVRQWLHCQGDTAIIAAPEVGAAITFGSNTTYSNPAIDDTEIAECESRAPPAIYPRCQHDADTINSEGGDYTKFGTVAINSSVVASFACVGKNSFLNPSFYSSSTPIPYRSLIARWPPRTKKDALCCRTR